MMKMLRDWQGDSNKILISYLNKFNVKAKSIGLTKFEALTPDSCIWFINTETGRYCLYVEDYVPSLDHVRKQIKNNRAK